jgi:hypothetical protein
MTKRDYELIAASLNGTLARANAAGNGVGMVKEAIADMADRLVGSNPRFDKGRFIRAALGDM